MKAVICGAGIAGLTLAQRLSVSGWDVVVLEKAPSPRTQGYMIDFFGAGFDAADEMGVLPRLRELGYRVEEARFVDARGRRRARIRYTQFAQAVADRLLSITRPDLELALREHLPDEVELRFATSLTHIENRNDGVDVTLADGQVLHADLLVGADGIHSAVRALVFGEESKYLRYLGFHTAAYTFHDPAIHAEVGDRFCLTDSVDRQMGLYGLRDGRVATFAVHRATDPTLPRDPRATLLAEYGSLGWVVPDALAQCPPSGDLYYDQVAQTEVPRWRSGRVVLEADPKDPNRLDADHDGQACESWFATGGEGTQVKVKPVGGVDTGGEGPVDGGSGALVGLGGLVLVAGAAGTVLVARRRSGH